MLTVLRLVSSTQQVGIGREYENLSKRLIARLLRYEKVELIWGAVLAAMTPKNASTCHIKSPQKVRFAQ